MAKKPNYNKDITSEYIEAQIGAQTFLTLGKEMAYYHHEKWNGTGYPNGLKGEEIPLSARIVSIADVYDGLTSQRIYTKTFFIKSPKRLLPVIMKADHFQGSNSKHV